MNLAQCSHPRASAVLPRQSDGDRDAPCSRGWALKGWLSPCCGSEMQLKNQPPKWRLVSPKLLPSSTATLCRLGSHLSFSSRYPENLSSPPMEEA